MVAVGMLKKIDSEHTLKVEPEWSTKIFDMAYEKKRGKWVTLKCWVCITRKIKCLFIQKTRASGRASSKDKGESQDWDIKFEVEMLGRHYTSIILVWNSVVQSGFKVKRFEIY